jgi:hypothetical protein
MVAEIGAVTVMVAVACFVGSETDVAVKFTFAGFGTLAGAVYVIGVPDGLEVADRLPHALPVQALPESVQRTP